MPGYSDFGTGQRWGFAALGVGFVLCLIGGCAPNWFLAEFGVPDVVGNIPVVGGILNNILDDVNLMEINIGVWVTCVSIIEGDQNCYKFYHNDQSFTTPGGIDINNDDSLADLLSTDWITYVRAGVSLNIILSLIAAIAACCRVTCCSGGETIFHGVVAFLAGGCGIFAFVIMMTKKDSLLLLKLLDTQNDWAFYLYAVGSGLICMSSLLLGCSQPTKHHGGTVLPTTVVAPAPFVIAATNSSINHHQQGYPMAPFPTATNVNGMDQTGFVQAQSHSYYDNKS